MESSLDNIVISNVNNIKTTAKDVIKSNPMALETSAISIFISTKKVIFVKITFF